ncbi:alpha/beta hydrolase-fold protein [uncultured Azohydromonas sp.]|uniref:alpha/beta hydrolase n=1 Tax=uncultured Azohydromonas sp. TaxID=487342 RepID=UPI00261C4441|nr:alpha/beta hydrolase-fold protein [uncultured Azohydromonas sp.]
MPTPPLAHEAGPGLHEIDVGAGRPALVHVPAAWTPSRPAACAVILHGSGSDPRQGLALLEPHAAAAGVIVAAPPSSDYTWDRIRGSFGPDVAIIDRLLRWVFARYDVAPRQLALGGFSDGASYALSLGLDHGELFPRLIALAPGFAAPVAPRGRPRIFIAHGNADRVLPAARCSRRVVPMLQGAGYEVRYLEFDGGHEVPSEVAREAVGEVTA